MEVICLQDEALYELIETCVKRLSADKGDSKPKWIGTDEAMAMLGIKSKTTLQKMRDEGRFTFTQPEKRIILYDRYSIEKFLDDNAKKPY